jgi:hypothetical protein
MNSFRGEWRDDNWPENQRGRDLGQLFIDP